MRSLRFKITMYFVGLIIFISILFGLGMNQFIDGYYYGRKVETMDKVIDDINRMYDVTSSEDEALMNIEYLGYNFEGKISIYDKNSQLVIFDSKNYQYTKGKIIEELNHKDQTAYVYETSYPVEGARWLMYIDELDNDKVALLQIPVVAIDEAIDVIQSFFNYLLGLVLIVALILSFVLARNISAPIMELQKVAKSIGELKFDVKYSGSREDEIGQLGNRLNNISITLQETIDNLQVELEKGKSVDRMRRRFVAQVSHELQTPISIISSYMEALCDEIVDEDEIFSYYHVIEDESSKMSRIIKDLLQLSQLEANSLKFKMEKIDFTDFLGDILKRYEPMAVQQDHVFEYDLNNVENVYVLGDSLKLEQGIKNILSNAFKHSTKLIGVHLTLENNRLMLDIENSGQLIDAKDINHIFESFYKGETSLQKEGTGLGLSIASKIFDKHKIDYKVFNKEAGVVFRLNIPIVQN